jgi:hypothetical protein
MASPASYAQQLIALFKELFPGDDISEYHKFWDSTFNLLNERHYFDNEAIKARAKTVLQASNRFLRSFTNDKSTLEDDFGTVLYRYISQGNAFKVEPSYFGYTNVDFNDAETALGFYRYLSPYIQLDDSFSIFAPCVTNMMQRPFEGSSICALSSKLVYHKLITGDQEAQISIVVEKLRKRFYSTIPAENRLAAFSLLTRLIRIVKSFNPIFPLINSQIFYEEGIRFYQQEARNLYVSSTTSGLIVPEEFYGGDFYYPGITDDFPPSTFSRENVLNFDTNITLQDWDEHLRATATQIYRTDNREIKNPYRNRYFIDGIYEHSLPASGKTIHYQYLLGGVAKALQSTLKSLTPEKKALYLRDTKAIFRYFYEQHCEGNLILYENERFSSESKYITLTPDAQGMTIISSRGKEKQIIHGFYLNVSLISALGLGGFLFQILNNISSTGALNYAISTLSTYFANRIIQKRFDSVAADFQEDTVQKKLKRFETDTEKEDYLEVKINEYLQYKVPADVIRTPRIEKFGRSILRSLGDNPPS